MAFVQRPDGLIDVDTPMGPLPMAPDVAMQLGWTPGTAEAGVQGPPTMAQDPMATAQATGLSSGDREVLGLSPEPPRAFADPGLASVMNATAPSSLVQQRPMAQQQTQAPAQPSGPSMLDIAMSLPGGREASASTKSGPAPITGPERMNMEAAQQSQLGALQKSAQAEGAIADMMTQQAGAEAAKARQIQQNDIIRQQRTAERMAELQNKREELRRAVPDEIDSARWNKMGGGGAVLAAVSIALGGIAQGLTGRDNPGMATINDLIARDIAAQKDEIALAQDSADIADNDLQRYMDIYGDPLLAEKQLEINDLEAMKKETQARIQGSQAEAVKAGGMQLIAELEEQQALKRNEMDGRAQQVTTQSQFEGESPADQWQRLAQAKAMDASKDDPFANMDDRSKRDAVARLVILPSGQKGFAPTDGEGKAMRAAKVAYDQYAENVDRLLEMAAQGDNLTLDGRGEMEALIQDNAIAIKNIKELGALVGADWGIVDPLSGKGVKDLIAPGAKQMIVTSKKRMGDELTKKWGTLLDAPFSTNLLNPTGGVTELPGPGD